MKKNENCILSVFRNFRGGGSQDAGHKKQFSVLVFDIPHRQAQWCGPNFKTNLVIASDVVSTILLILRSETWLKSTFSGDFLPFSDLDVIIL